MTPGEPVNPILYGPGTIRGVAWTGEKSPFGVPYTYPEWFWQSVNGTSAWRMYDTHAVQWTLTLKRSWGPELSTGLFGGESFTYVWWLTEGGKGWTILLGGVVNTGAYVVDPVAKSRDVLRVADLIIRNVENREGIEQDEEPRIRPGTLRPGDVIGEWMLRR